MENKSDYQKALLAQEKGLSGKELFDEIFGEIKHSSNFSIQEVIDILEKDSQKEFVFKENFKIKEGMFSQDYFLTSYKVDNLQRIFLIPRNGTYGIEFFYKDIFQDKILLKRD